MIRNGFVDVMSVFTELFYFPGECQEKFGITLSENSSKDDKI